MPTSHGGAQRPEPPMASFLPIFVELPLTPMEDERRQGAAEPDIQRSLPTMVKPPGQPFSHLDWTSRKTQKLGKKRG